MSTEVNVQIVKDFFAAMGTGDKQGLLALSAEDIEWIIPGEDWPLAGMHRGHAELADVLQKASEGFVTSARACRIYRGPVANKDDENQFCWIPVPARDHPPSGLAVPSVYPQLTRRRGLARGARDCGVLRDRPTLGEPLWADHRGGFA